MPPMLLGTTEWALSRHLGPPDRTAAYRGSPEAAPTGRRRQVEHVQLHHFAAS